MKGVDDSATSQISKPVYSSYTHLPEEDTVSQDSPTQTDFEVIPPINPQLLTITMSRSNTPGNTGAHILVYPFPAPGHIIPLIDLIHLLLTRGLTITVLVSPSHLPLCQPILSNHLSFSIQPLVLPLPHSFTFSQSGLLGKIRATGELYDPILQWFRSHPSPLVASYPISPSGGPNTSQPISVCHVLPFGHLALSPLRFWIPCGATYRRTMIRAMKIF
ncbi:hypothetical protein HYC85_030011 [Camellia sinensis]|uniref:Uncharacterized protein n=1 Tax=Camellia sinensis TaxID=4442 RepID=A0A7J7FZG9_CAMSI|nr:hypothetical protein HYC85_030011 [Camellia sinensis]